MTDAEIAAFDRRELAFARREYRAAMAAWSLRGSDRNIDRLFRTEARYLAVKAAIDKSRRERKAAS